MLATLLAQGAMTTNGMATLETCDQAVKIYEKQNTRSGWSWVDDHLIAIVMMLMVAAFLAGCACGWQTRKKCAVERATKNIEKIGKQKKSGTEKASQAQCTYTYKSARPRFQPLPDESHG